MGHHWGRRDSRWKIHRRLNCYRDGFWRFSKRAMQSITLNRAPDWLKAGRPPKIFMVFKALYKKARSLPHLNADNCRWLLTPP
jgi:hypothetical protein